MNRGYNKAKIVIPKEEKYGVSSLAKEFDHSAIVSLYFGFTPINTPRIEKSDMSAGKSFGDSDGEMEPLCENCAEKMAVLRTYQEEKFSILPHPILIEYKKTPGKNSNLKRGMNGSCLEILGLSGAVAEAIAIRTVCSMLEDEGYENLEIRINTIGDKDSISDFERGINVFLRKNGHEIPAEIRKALKKDIFAIHRSKDPKWEKWKDIVPKSMSFLSEGARQHFKEVLEYIEALGFPYAIKNDLIGNPRFCSQTIFEIVTIEKSEEIPLAKGYRYGKISKKAGLKRELPALGVSVAYKTDKPAGTKNTKGISKSKFYLVQIGFAAKLKALNIIESLRKAKIPVMHSITRDKLTSQMASAENQKITHIILIGQKEALEDSVVVRDTVTRSQVSVPISELAEYLKKLK